jgi:Flp pilus assembly protein TadD
MSTSSSARPHSIGTVTPFQASTSGRSLRPDEREEIAVQAIHVRDGGSVRSGCRAPRDRGRDAEALRVIDEALTHEPRNALLHAWRGLLLHALRRYDEEIVELRHAVSLDERSWEAVLHLGLGYSRRMQYDLALPALRRAVALSDTSALSLAWLGRVSADAGDVAGAERIAAQRRALAPARGLSPSLGDSVGYHIEARRRR